MYYLCSLFLILNFDFYDMAKIENQNEKAISENGKNGFALGKKNYIALAIGFAILVIGYALMSGGASTDPNVFNGDEIFSFRRITLAPIVLIIGFAVEIFAIMWRPRTKKD